MKTAVVLGLVLSVALSLRAQQGIYNGAISQARRAVSKTEAASSQTPDDQQPSQSAPAAQAPQPMSPALQATLQNIASLQTDLGKLDTNTPPAESFSYDLIAAASGTKASPDTIARLAGDLSAAIAGKSSFHSSYKKLAQYLHALSNGAHLTAAQFQMISDDVEQILENGGATYESTSAVLTDIKHLDRETQ